MRETDKILWTCSSGRIELQIKLEDAENCSHSGRCDEDVEALLKVPYIVKQLAKLDPELVRKELREYGAWDDEELADHEVNLSRLLWIACGDVREENDS